MAVKAWEGFAGFGSVGGEGDNGIRYTAPGFYRSFTVLETFTDFVQPNLEGRKSDIPLSYDEHLLPFAP